AILSLQTPQAKSGQPTPCPPGFDSSVRPKSCPWFDCKVTLDTLSGFQYRDAFPSIVEEQVQSMYPICPDGRDYPAKLSALLVPFVQMKVVRSEERRVGK